MISPTSPPFTSESEGVKGLPLATDEDILLISELIVQNSEQLRQLQRSEIYMAKENPEELARNLAKVIHIVGAKGVTVDLDDPLPREPGFDPIPSECKRGKFRLTPSSPAIFPPREQGKVRAESTIAQLIADAAPRKLCHVNVGAYLLKHQEIIPFSWGTDTQVFGEPLYLGTDGETYVWVLKYNPRRQKWEDRFVLLSKVVGPNIRIVIERPARRRTSKEPVVPKKKPSSKRRVARVIAR